MIFLFHLDDQCRCGVERPDTKRNSFNRIIGGLPVDKVSKIISQQHTLCEAQGKDISISEGIGLPNKSYKKNAKKLYTDAIRTLLNMIFLRVTLCVT